MRSVARFDHAIIVNEANDGIAIDRTRLGIDGAVGIVFSSRGVILSEYPFLLHDLHRVIVCENYIVERFSGTMFSEHSIHNLGSRTPPVTQFETRLGLKGFPDRFHAAVLKRSINDNLAAF